MKTINKIQTNFAAIFTVALLLSNATFALIGNQIQNPLGDTNSLQDFFMGIVGICIELGTIVSVLGIMYGGFLYATAQGDEEKIGKAYKTITWALVGTAVLLGARTIMVVISGTISSLGTQNL
jgi:hypothetical protein